MRIILDQVLDFWMDTAYSEAKSSGLAQRRSTFYRSGLVEWEKLGNAMRYLTACGRLAWRASPNFLERLAEEELEAREEDGDGDYNEDSNDEEDLSLPQVLANDHEFRTKRKRVKISGRLPYSSMALMWDLQWVREAWCKCRKSRDRDAVYDYLAAVYELVAWWSIDGRANRRASKALRLNQINEFSPDHVEPFAAVIRCTSSREKVDPKTRSKWARALRYALAHKNPAQGLKWFMKDMSGINACASGSYATAQPGRKESESAKS
jgi:hypothetical protein